MRRYQVRCTLSSKTAVTDWPRSKVKNVSIGYASWKIGVRPAGTIRHV